MFEVINRFYKSFLDFLFVIFHPYCWKTMYCVYNEEWDNYLNYLIKNYTFEIRGDEYAVIGNVDVRIAPYEYAISPDGTSAFQRRIRPSKRTIHKVFKKLNQDAAIMHEKALIYKTAYTTQTRRSLNETVKIIR